MARNIALGERDVGKIAEVVHRVGRTRWREVILDASVASTTVTDPTVTTATGIMLVPRTANAAIELHTTPYCLITMALGSFTISHANNAQTDRTFFWSALGD